MSGSNLREQCWKLRLKLQAHAAGCFCRAVNKVGKPSMIQHTYFSLCIYLIAGRHLTRKKLLLLANREVSMSEDLSS